MKQASIMMLMCFMGASHQHLHLPFRHPKARSTVILAWHSPWLKKNLLKGTVHFQGMVLLAMEHISTQASWTVANVYIPYLHLMVHYCLQHPWIKNISIIIICWIFRGGCNANMGSIYFPCDLWKSPFVNGWNLLGRVIVIVFMASTTE